jgi:hypothetical protein
MKALTKTLEAKKIKHVVKIENDHHVLHVENKPYIKKARRPQMIFFVDLMLFDALVDMHCIEQRVKEYFK